MKKISIVLVICFLSFQSIYGQKEIDWLKDIEYMESYLRIVHPAPFVYVTEGEFNERINYIKENHETLSDAEIITRIVEIFSLIQDGHTDVNMILQRDKNIKSLLHAYPLFLYKFSDGLFPIWANNKHKEIVGKRILKIGNIPADEALYKMTRLNSGDNEMGRTQFLPVIMEYLQYVGVMEKTTKTLKLVLEDENGEEFDYELSDPESFRNFYFPKRIFGIGDKKVTSMNDNCNNPLPLYLSHVVHKNKEYIGEYYWYEYIPEHDAMYVNISLNINIDDDPFNEFCKRMFNEFDRLKAKKLIVDVRLNDGGNHIEMPLIKGIIARPHIDTKDNLFLITGRITISASQHLTSQMEKYTNATIYGEPTASRPNMVGSTTRFVLPSSKLNCKTAKEYTQDSDYYDSRLTTKPHVYALLSSIDYKNNIDPVLEKIFKHDSIIIAKKNLQLAMQEGYKKNRIEGLMDAFYRNKEQCNNLGLNVEFFLIEEFSYWIYDNRKSASDYSDYIKFVVDELPNSVQANYWYGRNRQLKDDDEMAKKYYKKCLQLNPGHSNALKYLNLVEMHEKYEIKNYGR